MAFAALWGQWRVLEGALVERFTILSTGYW